VAIVGIGFIGLLAAMVYRHQYGESIEITGVEKSEARLAQLKALGLEQYFTNLMTSEQFEQAEPTGVDSVFCSVLTQTIAEHAIRHVRDGGVILQFSRGMGQIPTTFDANDLYYREISVLPSYSPNLADLQKAGEMINQQTIDVTPLYTHQYSLVKLNEAVAAYRQGEAIKAWLIP
jgi:threonine dehydrogenase-like Zn-dependent dehydrogenase